MRANNFSIADELGCIDYVLSDKTGTLTKNKLSLDALYVAGEVYGGKISHEENTTHFDKFDCYKCENSDDRNLLFFKKKGKFSFYDPNFLI